MTGSLVFRPAALVVAACGFLHAGYTAALEVRGVSLPERIAVDGAELVLNGGGALGEAGMDRYVVGLYLAHRQGRLETLLVDRARKRLTIAVLRTTSSARLVEALTEAIAANHAESEVEALRTPLDEFNALLGGLGALRAGDAILIDYVLGTGTRIELQGTGRGGIVRGTDVYHAVLRAWLGTDPVDRRLRRALLGDDRTRH